MGLLNVELCDKSVPHEPPEIGHLCCRHLVYFYRGITAMRCLASCLTPASPTSEELPDANSGRGGGGGAGPER